MDSKENKSCITMKDKESWILHQKKLLELERLAEVESSTNEIGEISLKQLEAKGVAISRLHISERATGLFGRPTVTLCHRYHQGVLPQLPSHTFSSGDIVGIWENSGSQKGEGRLASGVVSKLTSSSIQIALDDESPELEGLTDFALLRIHKLANDITYQRIKRGLDDLGKNVRRCSYHLTEVLFKECEPYDPLPQVPSKLLNKNGALDQFNERLDVSQIDAVKFALTQKDLAVVHGPPGTGKTTTLVEIILQHVKLGCKVLAVAPSNLAVDNLLEKLVDYNIKVVRVGHPARATTKAQQRSLDALIQNSEEFELIQDIHKDIKNSVLNLARAKDKGKKFKFKEEIKNFRKELKEREMRLSKDILTRSDVILTTLASAGNSGPLKLLPEDHFSLAVIDECSQGLECACYMALMKAPKLLIAGDHQQLPPTIISTEAAKAGLLVSLMERVIDVYQNRVTRMLKTQYRMNSCIMNWASDALYEGQLKAHESVSSHLLFQMNGVDKNEDTEDALILIDTAGCNFEEVSGDDLSKGNEGEAAIVAEQVKRLIASGVEESDVAVISPYNLQVEMIRTLLRDVHPSVEVRSVDGFQGREKEAILISLVRSNKQGDIGFLAEDRRLNVAVTRARRQLTLICDTDTVCRHAFIKALVNHISANGVVRSAHEFESEFDVQSRIGTYKAPPLESSKPSKIRKDVKNEKKPQRNKDEDNETRRKEYEAKISEFVKTDQFVLEFPKNLNSFERLLIHEIAGKYGLVHGSQGEGKERFIVLKKAAEDGIQTEEESKALQELNQSDNVSTEFKGDSNRIEDSRENRDIPSLDQDSKIKIAKNVTSNFKHDHPKSKKKKESKSLGSEIKQMDLKVEDKPSEQRNIDKTKGNSLTGTCTDITNTGTLLKTCKLCQEEVSPRNYDLHVLRCEKLQREEKIKAEIKKRQTEIKGVKKKQPKEKTEKEDDFEIMEKYSKENNSCAFPRCKNPSILLLQLCSFCKNNFCLKHHQAEIHGCGEEARKHARTVLLQSVRNGVLTPGSRVPSKKPDAVKRGQLQRKLNKKLDDMGGQRKGKKEKEK